MKGEKTMETDEEYYANLEPVEPPKVFKTLCTSALEDPVELVLALTPELKSTVIKWVNALNSFEDNALEEMVIEDTWSCYRELADKHTEFTWQQLHIGRSGVYFSCHFRSTGTAVTSQLIPHADILEREVYAIDRKN